MDRDQLKTQPAAQAESTGKRDYAALGFMCGLEIHQQLATGKLFCRCPGTVVDVDEVPERTEFMLKRRLYPTQSELGQLDPAARAEAERGLTFVYHGIRGHSCLVDADEEPPHELDDGALDATLTIAALLESRPVDEVQTMRKIVIDGSNTTGFQRTALVSLGGKVDDVGVWTIAVEEDSCRKLEKDEEGLVHYTLDRLGIPLVEIATAPDIRDPEHAKRTAARIGALLRATGKVRRGLGTIRQDLNVSIANGDRVEIKGAQDLRAIPRILDREVDRQMHLVKVRDELRARNVTPEGLQGQKPQDVSAQFKNTTSKMIMGALKRGGVYALVMPGFGGMLKASVKDGPRLGRELADHAIRRAGVKGIFHSDELPAYGITQQETDAVRKQLKIGEQDAFALVVAPKKTAHRALEAVRDRAITALEGVPREVRFAKPDDTTTYLRPLPGAARMYPETDVRPIAITKERWQTIQSDLPETPEESEARLAKEHGLSKEITKQIVAEGHLEVFDHVVSKVGRPNEASRFLLQIVPELHGDGIDTSVFTQDRVSALLQALDSGRFAKEALVDVARSLARAPEKGVEGAIEQAGASSMDEDEVRKVIETIVSEKKDLVKQRGEGAIGPLMGVAMGKLRGKADGALVSKLLKEAIQKQG